VVKALGRREGKKKFQGREHQITKKRNWAGLHVQRGAKAGESEAKGRRERRKRGKGIHPTEGTLEAIQGLESSK